MNRRRFVLASASAFAMSTLALAQPGKQLQKLGLLYPNRSSGPEGSAAELFRAKLASMGWSEGKSFSIVHASAEGREDRLPALAAELVAKRVDVIWAAGPEAAIAAARATTTIPIAFYGVGFPVEQGLVDSLARPGRNVTGLASLAGTERQKAVELLKEAVPKVSSIAWIGVETIIPTLSGGEIRISQKGIAATAESLGMRFRRHPVSAKEDFDAAFQDIAASRAEALGADFTALTYRESQRIVDFANARRLPSVFGTGVFAEAGGLLSYGANRKEQMGQSFSYVDRILRGARPADLPVELPSRFELFVNLKTAKHLGLALPRSILVRADRVIE